MEIGSVYIIQTVDERYIKIGFTSRPVILRLDELQSMKLARDHGGIEVLGFFPASVEVETELHRLFDEYRFQGEWYDRIPVLERFSRVTIPVFVNQREPMSALEFRSNGGKARAIVLSPERRIEIARNAGKMGERGRKKKNGKNRKAAA